MNAHPPQGASGRSISAVLFSLTGTALLAAGVAFSSNILAARALGPELRGNIAFVLQSSYFLAPLLVVGSDRALLRAQRVTSDTFRVASRSTIAIAASASLLTLYVLFRDWHALIAPCAVVTAWFLIRRADVVAFGNYRRYVIIFAIYQLGILASHFILFLLGVTAWPWWLAAYAAPTVVLLAIPPSHVRHKGGSYRANAPLLLSSMTKLWSLRGERLLLPVVAGPSALGLYVVVATATEPLYWIAQTLADHRVNHTPPATTLARLRSLSALTAIFLVATACLGLLLWHLLVPVFGPNFAEAKPLVLPLSLAAVSLAAYRQVAGWVLASDRPQRIGALESLVALIAFVAYPAGVLVGGAAGAAWATLAVYTAAAAVGLHKSFHSPDTKVGGPRTTARVDF